MNFQDIIIGEAEYARINECLHTFLRDAQGKCAILVDRDGQMLAKQGFTQNLDTMALSALAAGAIASTQEIARLLGEPEFSVLFNQGRHDHIHFSLVGQRAILMSVFDDRTTIGLIRLVASRAVEVLGTLLDAPELPPLHFGGDEAHSAVAAQLDAVLGVE
jgi:predicted regulator of Ras-like GTPase activity (Roadblock/LC7/MglB family)